MAVEGEKNLWTIFREYCPDVSNDNLKSLMVLEHNGKPMFSLENNPDFIYETVNMIHKLGFSKIYSFLKSLDVNKKLTPKIYLETETYNEEQGSYLDDIKRLREKLDLQNGDICRRCGQKNTITYPKQMSSGDEAATYVVYCYDCNFDYKL
jgi:DNA-directed RNA polymerase subunit M/transcription elongation factor TFIIS